MLTNPRTTLIRTVLSNAPAPRAWSRGVRLAVGCLAIAGSTLLGACSSSRTTYVHSDNGTGLASSSDALGSSIGSRLRSERRAARADADLPLFLTVAPENDRASQH